MSCELKLHELVLILYVDRLRHFDVIVRLFSAQVGDGLLGDGSNRIFENTTASIDYTVSPRRSDEKG